MTETKKTCHICAQDFPADEEHFGRNANSPDGLRNECKPCRSELRKKYEADAEQQQLTETVQGLDEKSLEAIDRLAKAQVDFANVPHVASFLEELMNCFGGPAGYAQHYVGNYLMAKPGGAIRQRMLDRVLTLAKSVTESGAADLPLDQMSREQLIEKKSQLEKRLAKQFTVYREGGDAAS